MKKLFRYLLPVSVGILSVYFILWYMSTIKGWISLGSYLDIIRWAGEICLVTYAIKRSNLTIWIFTSMFIGAEIGLYYPEIAENGKTVVTITGIEVADLSAKGFTKVSGNLL